MGHWGILVRAALTVPPQQLHGATFKDRAPKAIKEIKKFATLAMVCIPIENPLSRGDIRPVCR